VFVDPARLLSVHPDLARLRQLDQTIARASRRTDAAEIAPLRAPEPVSLSVPNALIPSPATAQGVDDARAKQAIRDDFEIRRQARPEQEEDRYRRDMERLRRRYLELRREPRAEAAADDLALALRNARRMSDLMEQLRALRERPEDRLFHNAAQLRRRRELYRLTEQDLEELRREEARRLERALDGSGEWTRQAGEPPREIPPEEIARLERERDTLRREALAELDRLEALRIEAVEQTRVPASDVTAVQPAESDDSRMADVRAEVAARVKAAESGRRPAPSAPRSSLDAAQGLRQEREELKGRLLQEVRALAAAAAKSRGWSASFTRGIGPDRTAAIADDVRRLIGAARGGGGIR
jgi:hypothetical protein